jgi:hypothetical protein
MADWMQDEKSEEVLGEEEKKAESAPEEKSDA